MFFLMVNIFKESLDNSSKSNSVTSGASIQSSEVSESSISSIPGASTEDDNVRRVSHTRHDISYSCLFFNVLLTFKVPESEW